MPWPRAVARLNKRYTNRFIEPIVSRFPGFVVVHHQGRRSGTSYSTPLYAFGRGDGLLIALTYGVHADWAQNVLAGGGTIDRKGTTLTITSATLLGRSDAVAHIPFGVQLALRVLRVRDFVHLAYR